MVNRDISLVWQMGWAKWLTIVPPKLQPPRTTFMYMDELWLTYVLYPDLQEKSLETICYSQQEVAHFELNSHFLPLTLTNCVL